MLWVALFLLAGLPVLIESVNKIHRTDISVRTLRTVDLGERVSRVLRAVGWFALLLAGGGILFAETLPVQYLQMGYALAMIGSAALVARARLEQHLQEQKTGRPAPEHDAFERTQLVRLPVVDSEAQLRAALRASTLIDRDVNRTASDRAQAERG